MNNTSFSGNESLTEDSEFLMSTSVSIFLGVLALLLAIGTLVANTLLIAAVFRTTYLHTKTNAFLVCVSASDIIFSVFVMPFSAVVFYVSSITLNVPLCKFVAYMTSLSRAGKSLSMLGVSLDRCIAISHPLQYSAFVTKKTTSAFISVIWFVSAGFALLPLINVGNYGFVEMYGRCLLYEHSSPAFTVVKETLCTIVPSCIILVTLVIIMVEVRSHHRVTAIAQLSVVMYTGPRGGQAINFNRSTYRAMRAFLIITAIYLCTCFPHALYIVLAAGNQRHSKTFIRLVYFLYYVCNISTPLVITTLNIKFRQSIKSLFKPHNKVVPLRETEVYTISTGLQSVMEASIAFSHITTKDLAVNRLTRTEMPLPGMSSKSPMVAHFQPKRVPSLLDIRSSSDSASCNVIIAHAPLRKSSSSPI
ncbi:hypothetical protein DPMN_188823 [Dreissena polymorpha]|uniref:G-protein coupled receptors family 1 profile domain-containing protein n=1 Tax=Dreissena polymorpha TaxID=45954 RepID=A0A9D4DTR2_DREPO|nr:hypothetical protein DPMN_188823 [Dreissena polymorpha]